ncbi:MAG: VOC family protein [Leptospiraceae bacterium]|nr:VOC family protein [Leptospiraceae bacterium]
MFPRMHASIYVSDLDKSVDFYSKFFEVQPAKIRAGYAKFQLENPGLVFSLVENKDRVAGNFGHMGIQVETLEELDARKEKAKKTGLLGLEEKEVACCYAKQDKFWAVDPDGVQWEVYYFHEDVEFNDPAFSESPEQKAGAVCCSTEFSIEQLPASSNVASANVKGQYTNSVDDSEVSRAVSTAEKDSACCEPGAGCC